MTSPSVIALRTQSDDRLVALAAAGHERAFEAIVERYRRPLLRHCRKFLPEARAEDALQQALVAAWSALARGDDVRELRPWLYRIVHNTALNALRSSGFDYEELHDLLTASEVGGPAELAERSALVRQTLAGMAALPDRQREALLQIAVEGRSQDEVAAELGLSEGAVRQLVHRARTNLRAAATALTPLPLATAMAASGARGDLVSRMAELVTGAGAGATLAKAGAVAAIAGGAIAGPGVVDDLQRADRNATPAARAASAPSRPHAAQARAGSAATAAADATPSTSGRRVASSGEDRRARRGDDDGTTDRGRGSGGDDGERSGSGPGGTSRSGDDRREGDRSGTSGGGDDRSGPGGGDDGLVTDDDHSGPGSGDSSGTSGSSGSGTSGGDDDAVEADDHSGPGSGTGEIAPAATPIPTTTSDDRSGSGSSGSDSGLSGGGGTDDD
jgi:RNA polymerase sigma factor (sigma-70 family)